MRKIVAYAVYALAVAIEATYVLCRLPFGFRASQKLFLWSEDIQGDGDGPWLPAPPELDVAGALSPPAGRVRDARP